MTSWHDRQRRKLIDLRNTITEAVNGEVRGTHEGGETSDLGPSQAEVGSDTYDRDFAICMLLRQPDPLHELEAAITRMDDGTYGICEKSGVTIPRRRLEALPFARYTVEIQAQIEKEKVDGDGDGVHAEVDPYPNFAFGDTWQAAHRKKPISPPEGMLPIRAPSKLFEQLVSFGFGHINPREFELLVLRVFCN